MADRKPALSRRVTLRLPEATAADWRKKSNAAQQSMSDWVRQRVDGADAVQTGQRRHRRRLRTLTADPELLRELAAQGSNLNQIARVLNSVGLTTSDHAHLLAELAAIQRELHRLAELPRYDPEDEGAEAPCT